MIIIYFILLLISLAIVIWGAVTQWRFVKRKGNEGYGKKDSSFAVIALLLTRDEAPLLEDWLPRMSPRYEKIFVLDGSLFQKKESNTLLEKFGAIYLHDQDVTLTSKTDHGLRKPVLKEIKKYVKRFPNKEFWVQVAHPDEFYTDDLKNTIAIAKKAKADHVAYPPRHNFPHISELSEYKKTKSHRALRHFHDSNCWEQRLFKLSDSVEYADNHHSNVLPTGLKKGIYINSPYWHYKIYRPDISFYTKNGKEKTSIWTTLKSHYPDRHKFEKLDDFFIKEPSGIFKGAKIHIWSIDKSYIKLQDKSCVKVGNGNSDSQHKIYVETGTYTGKHICKVAQNNSYRELYSIDIEPERTALIKKVCNENKNIQGITGDSSIKLKEWLKSKSEPIDFYLDAHADGIPQMEKNHYEIGAPGYSYSKATELMPLLKECEIIAKYNKSVGNNRVSIDDVRCWDKDACPTSKLWKKAKITTNNILKIFGNQIKKWKIEDDRLHIELN